MAMHPALRKRLLVWSALLAGLASSLVAGITAEVAALPGTDLIYLAVMLLMAFIWTTTTVTLTLGRSGQFWASVLVGALVGALVFMIFIVGSFVPFAAGWDHRRLDLYGAPEHSWHEWLSIGLRAAAWTGAGLGFVAGLSSWAFRFTRGRFIKSNGGPG